tara:strand:- start:858 stop:1577 length:720 start_codon:yes stop_codon:yes gene_type:complete
MNEILKKIFERIYFWIGNLYRFLTAIFFLRRVKFNQCRTYFGVSFDNQKPAHHIIKTLKQYDSNPSINYKDTTMYEHLKYFQPESISQFVKNTPKEDYLPLFVYPWGTFKKNKNFSKKSVETSRFCGPSTDKFIENEFKHTIYLYNKLKNEGYRPWRNFNRHIGGTFLIDENNRKSFVVTQGNHRMAILSHINKNQKISVRNVPGFKHSIYKSELSSWFMVQNQQCSPKHAEDIFNLFF